MPYLLLCNFTFEGSQEEVPLERDLLTLRVVDVGHIGTLENVGNTLGICGSISPTHDRKLFRHRRQITIRIETHWG